MTSRVPGRRLLRMSLPFALHAVLFLGIYQSGYTPAERRQVTAVARETGMSEASAIRHVSGWYGYMRDYFQTDSDVRVYLEYARLTLYGQVDAEFVVRRQDPASTPPALPSRPWPYRDLRVEYPPLALIGILPPALISSDYVGYRFGLGLWLGVLHLLNLLLAWRLSTVAIPSADRSRALPAPADSIARLGWWSLAFSCALGAITVARIDHLVVTWVLLSVTALERAVAAEGRARARWAAICGALAAAGVLTKIVPALVIPAALARLVTADRGRGLRTFLVCVASALATLCALHVGFWALLGDGYLDTYRYHLARGVQIESLYAGLVLLAHQIGFPAQLDHSFGSANVASPVTGLVKTLSPLLFGASAGVLWLRVTLARRARSSMLLVTALVLLFMLCSPVLSPQYLIWIAAPLLASAAVHSELRPLAGLLILAAALTQVMFPHLYAHLEGFHPLMIGVLNLRNLVLIVLAGRLVSAQGKPIGRENGTHRVHAGQRGPG